MKAHENLGESAIGVRVAGNGFDEPKAASSVEMSTRLAAAQANGPVRAGRSPTGAALPVPLTQQAHLFPHFFSLLLQANTGEPGMGHHRQGNMSVPTVPEAHFIVI